MRLSNLIRPARKIRETSGPTILDINDIADGEFLKRVGSQVKSAAAGGGGGSVEWLQSIVLGSDQPVATFSGLDGDADYKYEIEGLFVPAGGGDWLGMNFNSNALPSGGGFEYVYTIGGFLGLGGVAAAGAGAYLALVSVYNDDTHAAYFRVQVQTARGRGYAGKESQGFIADSGSSEGNGDTMTRVAGTFRFQAANITAINLYCLGGGDLKAGSEFHLYRKKVS